jgi:hypothetical protein
MDYISYILSNEEHSFAKEQGTLRRQNSQKQGRTQRNNFVGCENTKLNNDIIGAIGELCVAKYLELTDFLFPVLEEVKGSFDLPPNLEVKNTHGHNRRLLIYLNDNPRKIFISCTYQHPEVRIHGWNFGENVMRKEFIEDPQGTNRHAYFVPQKYLQPMDELKSFVQTLNLKK